MSTIHTDVILDVNPFMLALYNITLYKIIRRVNMICNSFYGALGKPYKGEFPLRDDCQITCKLHNMRKFYLYKYQICSLREITHSYSSSTPDFLIRFFISQIRDIQIFYCIIIYGYYYIVHQNKQETSICNQSNHIICVPSHISRNTLSTSI